MLVVGFFLVLALISMVAFTVAFIREDKGYTIFFAFFTVFFGASIFYFEFVVKGILTIKNMIVFLVVGRVNIPMYGVYIIVILSVMLGLFIAAGCSIAREADKRAGMIDTVELGKKFRECDK